MNTWKYKARIVRPDGVGYEYEVELTHELMTDPAIDWPKEVADVIEESLRAEMTLIMRGYNDTDS